MVPNAIFIIPNSYFVATMSFGHHAPGAVVPLNDALTFPQATTIAMFRIVNNIQQVHRPGWKHCELVAFRGWIIANNPDMWFSIYCYQPNVNGQTPL